MEMPRKYARCRDACSRRRGQAIAVRNEFRREGDALAQCATRCRSALVWRYRERWRERKEARGEPEGKSEKVKAKPGKPKGKAAP
jgi:hypothetical protein